MLTKRFLTILNGVLVSLLILAGLAIFRPLAPAQAAPAPQVPIFTPTPGADGRIIWVVKANDTLLSISLITGVSVDELRALNNLTGDTILAGQQLLIGLAGPAEVTPTLGPTPTPTPIQPTPSPKPGVGTMCLILFDDSNGDSLRQEEELSIPGGALSISSRSGAVSQTADSDSGAEHHCFENLPEGEYTVSVAAPEGFNPTTTNSAVITLSAGDETYIDFGAQANSQTLAEAPILPTEGQRSPLFGIIGGLFLLFGIGLAIFAGRLLKSR